MKLEVINSKETSLVIDDVGRAVCENGFLGQGYMKAIIALREYINLTGQLKDQLNQLSDNSSKVNNLLYQSPQNIIAFCGKRGAGKTSSMLSFAEFLEKVPAPNSNAEDLKAKFLSGLRVTVLSPLDPTMLEDNQNILSIVLSRLLFIAEERWNSMVGYHRNFHSMEEYKNQLLMAGNECLNGIKAVKQAENPETLSDLQRISDSAILKKNLYDFVNMVNAFCIGQETMALSLDYLVIPIDDTDCQIQKAHDVMEDIRRYLTLPNVIILMATDADLLRTVAAQHYADEFDTGIKRSYIDEEEMPHIAEKYLTKLIPTTHRIYIPSFETIIQNHSQKLEFGYYYNLEDRHDIITGTTPEIREKLRQDKQECLDLDFQSKVLYYIYRKTGIVFISHSAYINNIIPTTMRGLAHLLSMLSKMQDVVDDKEIQENIKPSELVNILEKRLETASHNLDIFEEYFINEWIPTKVGSDMYDLMDGLERQVPEKWISFAFDKIQNVYKAIKGITLRKPSYDSLMDILSKINGVIETDESLETFNRRTDYYNISAVRFLLTIKNNRQAVLIMQEGINKWNDQRLKDIENPLIFDMDILGTQDSFPREAYKDNEYARKMMPVIQSFSHYLSSKTDWAGKSQFEVLKIQELAWKVLCNWDVQDAIYKIIDEYVMAENPPEEKYLWALICRKLAGKNCGMISSFNDMASMPSYIWPSCYKDLIASQERLLPPNLLEHLWRADDYETELPASPDSPDVDAAEGGTNISESLIKCLSEIKDVLARRTTFRVRDLATVMESLKTQLHDMLLAAMLVSDSNDIETDFGKYERIGSLIKKSADLSAEVNALSDSEESILDKKVLSAMKTRIRKLVSEIKIEFELD